MPAVAKQIRFEKVATAVGTYWRSPAPAASLRSHLRSFMQGPLFKMAEQAGQGGEQEFEQAFSSLAYAYLKDKAPRLLDYLVGFQLVDRNEDNTKAMGLFGFQVGGRGQWLYAPVFFLNGDLKGHELLYVKQQDAFRPMKENWVNYLMSRAPHVLGEGSQKNTYQLGGLMPDIYSMSISPTVGIGKRGSDSRRLDDWAKPALPLLAALMTKKAKALFALAPAGTKLAFDQVVGDPRAAALAEVAGALDLDRALPRSFALLKSAFEISRRYPLVKKGFDRFYGPDCFQRWGQELRAHEIAQAVALDLPQPPPVVKQANDVSLLPADPAEEARDDEDPIKAGELRVIEGAAITQHADDLTDEDRAKLLKDTVLIKDQRDPHGPKASIAYNTQVEQKLTNPAETGLYDMLEKPGDFTRMLIVQHPLANDGQQDFCTVVRIGDGNKAWLNAHRTAVWADKVELKDEFQKWFQGLGDKSSLAKGGVYLALNDKGQGSVPFEVRESYGDGAYKVDFKGHVNYSHDRADGLPRMTERSSCCGPGEYVSQWGAKLYVDGEDKKGTKLRALAGELRVPGDFKFLKLQDPPPPPTKKDLAELQCCPSPCGDSESGSKAKPIQPGKIEDIQNLFFTKTAALKVFGDHHEVVLRSKRAGDQRLTHPKALAALVRDHGLTEKQAREILAKAGERGVTNYRVKYAAWVEKRAAPEDAYALRGGPGAPPPPPPQMGMEMYGGRSASKATYPDESHQMVPELDSSMVDPAHRDMWRNYTYEDFQQTMGQAQQAAQQGQKEVFDTSMISGLLRSVRQDTLVDRYLGDLLKALDKLGRVLFMFYWHQEEFEDRYGKSSLPELEDALRNSFEALGDVTLYLKEKTIEPAWDDGGRPDPDVDDTAES